MWTAPPKPYPACPECECADIDCIESLSQRSDMDYLCCVDCGHVWTVKREATEPACEYPDDGTIKRV